MSELSERTFAATPRRRLQAQREGRIARSAQLTSALLTLVCAVAAVWLSGDVSLSAARWLQQEFSSRPVISAEEFAPVERLRGALLAGLSLSAGVMTLAFATTLAAELVQTGFALAWGKGAIDVSRLRMDGNWFAAAMSPARWCGAAARLLVVLAVIGAFVWSRLDELSGLVRATPPELATAIGSWNGSMLGHLAFALLVTGGLHYAWRRRGHEQSLGMTREEVREEERQNVPAHRRRVV